MATAQDFIKVDRRDCTHCTGTNRSKTGIRSKKIRVYRWLKKYIRKAYVKKHIIKGIYIKKNISL